MEQLDKYWAQQAAEVEAELLTRVGESKVRPRLEPTRLAVELLGDPQKSYRVIHVTGTNGKTSTTRFIERILREFGIRTGRFTSPHLVNFNERISIDGEPVSNEVLVETYREIKPIIEIVDDRLKAQDEGALTFFEILAVLAFAIFNTEAIEVLVLEVGMGGEWDSTNVADGDVAVFTPIGLDHVARLGDTIAEIAATKSGIIKPGAMVVSAKQPSEAREVLLAKTKLTAEKWIEQGEAFEIQNLRQDGFGQRFTLKTSAATYSDLYIPLLGTHQAENSAVAIAAVEAFMGYGEKAIPEDVLRSAMADVSSPGRLQIIDREPLVILDAAHNPHGAKSLANALVDSFSAPYTIAVLAVLNDKDAEGILRELDEVVSGVIITQSSSERCIPAAELGSIAEQVLGTGRVTVVENPAKALEQAKADLPKNMNSAVVVSGSISLIGDILAEAQYSANIDLSDEEFDEVSGEYEVQDIYEEVEITAEEDLEDLEEDEY
ncbi:MAG: bifunctional folylpolyglutamate synthase/dihydrofolate synthase [Micrococcales bacterium]